MKNRLNNSVPRALPVAACALWAAAGAAQPLPSEGQYQHLGPASCATSVCHGKVSPDEAANVWLNEYRVWSRDDYHSRAYTVLRSDESKTMADKLGLANATTAKICLDCHADNVPADKRGEKFQISDGVGCEACHGGAEKWIEAHAEEGATHEDNLALGMYPTEKPEARARLCLSCHVGTEEKFADHDIMAAGHPRMSFELETFTVNQPAHYHVDEDYLERKGNITSASMWANGMLFKARRQLNLINSDLFQGHGIFPELAFFDCHACHHPMDDRRMQPKSVTRGLPPGVVRLDDSSYQMLVAITEVIRPEQSKQLEQQVASLHVATTQGRQQLSVQAQRLDQVLQGLVGPLGGHDFQEGELREIRRLLLDNARRGEYRDFTSAEQAFLAVETLCIVTGEYDRFGDSLDAWFETLRSEHDFDPDRYAAVARQFLGNL